jgi:hypothetical protein
MNKDKEPSIGEMDFQIAKALGWTQQDGKWYSADRMFMALTVPPYHESTDLALSAVRGLNADCDLEAHFGNSGVYCRVRIKPDNWYGWYADTAAEAVVLALWVAYVARKRSEDPVTEEDPVDA